MDASRIRIYTRAWCVYCVRAIRLLDGKGLPYEKIDVTGDDAARRRLADETGQSTVPQIFIDGASIGGYTELAELDRRGGLEPLR